MPTKKSTGNILHTRDGALFVQTEWRGAVNWVGCVDLDTLNEPGGGLDQLIRCFRADGQGWSTISSTRTAPDPVTTTITELVGKSQSLLEQIRNCPVSLWIHQRDGGYANQFTNYARSVSLSPALFGDRGRENFLMRDTDEAASRTYAVSAYPPAYDFFKLKVYAASIASATAIKDIAFVDAVRCAGSAGPAQGPCKTGFAVANHATGSASDKASVWYTNNYASSWAVTAADPFAAAEDIASVVVVPYSSTINRVIVARGTTDAGNPAEIAYSDDNGATWTAVDVGAVSGAFAQGPNSLFALDLNNIWLVTDGGYVYYSDDGAVSWTAQESGVATSEDLYAVHFVSNLIGFAAGTNDAILVTIDGGLTWSLAEGDTGSGDDINVIKGLDANRAWVGTSGGEAYVTADGGATWEAAPFTGSGAGAVTDMEFLSENTGFLLHNTAGPVGSVYRTLDGGVSWEKWQAPTNTGFNALALCDENNAYAVGNVSAGLGVMVKVQPAAA